jgi:hypothetical protein
MTYNGGWGFDIINTLGDIGRNIGGGLRQGKIGSALEELGPDASWEDRAQAIMARDPKLGTQMLRYGDTLNLGREDNAIAAAKLAQQKPLTATDKRLIADAEDELPGLQGTIENLDAALAINDKTFQGATAGARGWLGSRLPDKWVPDQIADKATADYTAEWQNIMSPSAIAAMSASLKGATTNFELQKFERILADPSTPPKTRANVIKRMKVLAERQLEIKKARIKSLGASGGGEEPSGALDMPTDPSQLVVGKEYVSPSGARGVWNGEGFEVD